MFPNLRTTLLKDASPGSLLWMPRDESAFLVLATEVVNENSRDFVLIDGSKQVVRERPLPMYCKKWRADGECVSLGSAAEWVVAMDPGSIDVKGHKTFETLGALLLIGGDFFLRSVDLSDYGFSERRYVNIRDGTLLKNRPPNDVWTFLSWHIQLRGPAPDLTHVIFRFSAPVRSE